MKLLKDDVFHVDGIRYRVKYSGNMYYSPLQREVVVVHDDYIEKFNQDDFTDHLKGHGYIEEEEEDDIPLLRKKKLAMWTDVR